jgi:hypothetical protein
MGRRLPTLKRVDGSEETLAFVLWSRLVDDMQVHPNSRFVEQDVGQPFITL